MKRNESIGQLWRVLLAVIAILALVTGGFVAGAGRANAAEADDSSQSPRHFMVYYRAWRDKTMKGVNTDLPDDNWMTMLDIPYGVDVVNVFSYVPQGQEAQAKPFYDALKSKYVPALHARGIRLVRGVSYDTIADVPHAGVEPTQQEYDAYASHLVSTLATDVGLDGLDIDMEVHPDTQTIKRSNGVIRAMAKLIGPQSGNKGSIFLYDTNGSDLDPLREVEDSFDFVAYQQYGSDARRTDYAVNDYAGLVPPNRFVPGLTFPEEGDMNNRWLDATEPYESSNIYNVSDYVRQHNLGGMFLYALDRDGRTYSDDDLHHIKPSNLLWTKTAIAQTNGMSLVEAKQEAHHFLERMKYRKSDIKEASDEVDAGANLYEVNKSILGADYRSGYDPTYDPTLEQRLSTIDVASLERNLDTADSLIAGRETVRFADSDRMNALIAAKDAAVTTICAKEYTAEQIDAANARLVAAIYSFGQGTDGAANPAPSGQMGTNLNKPGSGSEGSGRPGASVHHDSRSGRLASTGARIVPLGIAVAIFSAMALSIVACRRRLDK